MYFCWFKHISPAFANIMLGVVFIMTNQEIFESKKAFNKWLEELTGSELQLVIEMLDEAREQGYKEGQSDAHSSFQDEISHRGWG